MKSVIHLALTSLLLSLNGCDYKEVTNLKNKKVINYETREKFFYDSYLKERFDISADYWINSKPLEKKDLEGKTILLDFWASWCGPCVESLPDIEKIWQENKDNGFIVIGIHTKVNDKNSFKYIERFVEDRNLTFPIAIDKNGETFDAYRVKTIPYQVLIDKNDIKKDVSLEVLENYYKK